MHKRDIKLNSAFKKIMFILEPPMYHFRHILYMKLLKFTGKRIVISNGSFCFDVY